MSWQFDVDDDDNGYELFNFHTIRRCRLVNNTSYSDGPGIDKEVSPREALERRWNLTRNADMGSNRVLVNARHVVLRHEPDR